MRDFVPLLFADPLQVIKVSRLTFGNSTFSSLHRFSMGLRSGDWLAHSRTIMCFFLSHSFVALAVCFGSLSCWNTHPRPIFNALAEGRRFSSNIICTSIGPSMQWSRPVPLAEKQPQSMMFPRPCLTVGNESSWCQRAKFWSHLTTTLSQFSSESLANFRQACTCAFLSRGTLRVLQDFSPLWRSVLPIVFLLTVVPTALRSLTSSFRVVLGWSLTFLMIILTPWGKILHGAPDRGQLMVVLYFFFHFR